MRALSHYAARPHRHGRARPGNFRRSLPASAKTWMVGTLPGMTVGTMLTLLLCAPAGAAPPSRDPDWPCQQIKVPQLSLASVWSGPSPEAQQDDRGQAPRVDELVNEIAPRRVPVEQAQEKIRAFAAQAGDQRQARLLDLVNGLFKTLNEERSTVIAGLDRFGARQRELATELRADNEKLRAMQADASSDAGDLNQLTQRVQWEAQVFQDRRQALSYACEVPAKIEQRLFTLARTIQDALQ